MTQYWVGKPWDDLHIPVMVVEPNPHYNNEQRTGLALVVAKAPASYKLKEGKPWVTVRWPDGATTREPMAHIKKVRGRNEEEHVSASQEDSKPG